MLDPSIFLDFTVYPHGWAPPKTSPWVATRFMHPHEWLLNCSLFHGRTHHACLHRVGPSMEERAGGFEKFSCNFLICAYYDLRILSVGNLEVFVLYCMIGYATFQVTGAQVAKLEHHDLTVRDCSWHPYYPMLVSSSWDGTVARWEFPGNGQVSIPVQRKTRRRHGY